MHDFDPIRRADQSDQYSQFEAEQFFARAEASPHEEVGEVFGETERLEFASELLEVASEAEFDDTLRDLIGRAGQAVGKIISSPEGNAIGSILKGAAKRVLSGVKISGRMASGAGREFGLELEGLSNEDREFEIARRYVDFAGEAVRNLTSGYPCSHPGEAAAAAVVEAAKTHAPGLLSQAGAQNRAYSAAFPFPPPTRNVYASTANTMPMAESEFDLTLGAPSKARYLRFMNLCKFIWNRASLTPDLRQKIELLAKEVKISWTTMHPIAYITLIGHTDNTGPEKYNYDLGNWRAGEVKKALENLLKEEILKRRVAIIVEQSPGASTPTADNRTATGRALNRRVEVFVASPEPPPAPPQKINWHFDDPNPPPPPVFDWKKKIGKGPPVGKSVDEWLDGLLDNIGVPKFLHKQILNAVYNKNWGLLSQLLEQAHITGDLKDAIINAWHGAFETKAN